MELVSSASGKPELVLPAIVDIGECASLKDALVEAIARGNGLDIVASDVQRITTPPLQVLVAAVRSFEAAGGSALRLRDPSDAFRDAAQTLAVAAALGLEGE